MTHTELIELAAHHEAEGRNYAAAAEAATPFVSTNVTARCRERAQWHSSTAIKLRELAEAIKSAFEPVTV